MSQKQQQHSFMDTANEVRDFYNRYPYPRPVESLDNYQKLWQDPQRRRAEYHLFWPLKSYRENISILVAGCGTSQAAKYAIRWPDAKVTGIDFSESSIQHTEDLKRKYSLTNLDIRMLPLERVEEFGKTFDQIICTGVLHHLTNPDAGLAALRNVLKPEGAMNIMVYAPYGRAGIYMLQEFCRRLGILATEEGIRNLISALKALPSGHPLEHLLQHAPDFKQEAALADALLNPRDRAYSVSQLFEFLGRAGLSFGRWLKQAPYCPRCGIMSAIPQTSRMADLSPLDQYAAVELFRGTMVRHSVVAYHDDSIALQNMPDFKGNHWPGYVPVRMPDTICVEEQLPPGTAGVLINRTHTYHDLYLPVSQIENKLFEAIDGERSIENILDMEFLPEQKAIHSEKAKAFFERLWWYDQVVFDTSQQMGKS